MFSKRLNIINIAAILFFCYYLQGIVYASGSFLSQFIVLIYLLLGLICFFKALVCRDNSKVVNTVIIFYILLSLSFIISPKTVIGTKYEAIGIVSTFDQFKGISLCILSFFISYYTTLKNDISEKNIVFLFFVFFAISIVRYLYSIAVHDNSDSFTNNSGYWMVSIIPFIPFLIAKNKLLGFSIVLSITYLTILSSKRGAIVCLIIALMIMLVYYFKNKKIKPRHIIVFAVIISLLAIFIYQSIVSNEYLISRLDYTSESGIGTRDIAYKTIWQHWYNDTNLITIVFGNGMASSITVWGNYAHNDWLELLINNGICGVFLYACFFVFAFLYIRRMNLDNTFKQSACLCLSIWFLKTIFSMGYTDIVNAPISILLGLIIGKNTYCLKNSYDFKIN